MSINLSGAASRLRRFLTNAGSEIGAWLAPLPSAVSVSNAAHRHLGYDPVLSFIVGAIVELLGFATTNRAADLWYYNQTRREDEPQAPFGLAVSLVALYVVSTIALSVLSDLATGVIHLLPAIFPVMALTGTINVALGRQHDLRLDKNRAAADERTAAAEHAAAERKRLEDEAKAFAEKLRLEQLQREKEAEEKAERLRQERRADRATRQTTRHVATPDATDVALDRDIFVRLFTTPQYDDVADLAHSLGFNGELKDYYTTGRRSVSRLASLVGVNPRNAQRWLKAAGVASNVADDDATGGEQ